ncbi:hypothetical protein LATKL145_17120 [Lactobacillus amylovorus subsp. animalium]|uniref:Uncharacterized protein n=1 Tax=Lactobacillus amylovorus subsp. animalium TaxID=3378536 RepID=A0ABC9VQ82_LACAM
MFHRDGETTNLFLDVERNCPHHEKVELDKIKCLQLYINLRVSYTGISCETNITLSPLNPNFFLHQLISSENTKK